ncbi:MAG: hypothetical protein FWG57_05905 [Endomicrobia bacterium]|nr:hypothetical protein [Endomicrobiia bacterium]
MKIFKPVFLLTVTLCIVLLSVAAFSEKEETKKDFIYPAPPDPKIVQKILDAADKHNMSMKYHEEKPFRIDFPGSIQWIDYSQFGEFQNVGKPNYKFVIKDMAGLKEASGSGIFPNTQSVFKEKGYEQYIKQDKLKGDKWEFVNSNDNQANFYKWAIEKDDPGVKLFYTAHALERAGNIKQAIKAYYACLVFFPKSVGFTQWKTPWYIGAVCIDKINYLTKRYPELGVKLEGAEIIIKNRYDNDKNNDIFFVTPGRLVPAKAKDFKRKYMNLDKVGVKKVTGKGKVKLIQYNNNHFRITVDDKPYPIRSVCYSPSPIGLTPDNGSLNTDMGWSVADINKNRIVDGPYEAWVDAERRERRDDSNPDIGDFALMKEMGINTIRLYHYANFNKDLLKDGYENYGFMYMIGNLLGMYGADSGAEWFVGTDYTDPVQKQRMLDSVRRMVEEYRDEPYTLLWILGNENNYGTVGTPGVFAGTSNQTQSQPEAYYAFVNECAKLIKELDPHQRPVAICNGDTYFLDICAKYAPDLDIYGANGYRGVQGFGPLWADVMREFGKPVLVTEFGCPAYAKWWETARIEQAQADYHKWNWLNIEDNMAGVEGGVGNALGGVIFEWVDEWWKAGPPPEFDPAAHDTVTQWSGPFLDGGAYEEWFGLTSQGDGKDSPFKRQMRRSYFMYRDLWKDYRVNKK